jgi:hypothetical protein
LRKISKAHAAFIAGVIVVIVVDDAKVPHNRTCAVVLERRVLKKNDPAIDFVTDAYATVAVAYHRAAGIYTMDKEMQELGTAAVHLLTMAIHQGAERLKVPAMTRDQSRVLKIYDRVAGRTAPPISAR